jgi:hypothetical protein
MNVFFICLVGENFIIVMILNLDIEIQGVILIYHALIIYNKF